MLFIPDRDIVRDRSYFFAVSMTSRCLSLTPDEILARGHVIYVTSYKVYYNYKFIPGQLITQRA